MWAAWAAEAHNPGVSPWGVLPSLQLAFSGALCRGGECRAQASQSCRISSLGWLLESKELSSDAGFHCFAQFGCSSSPSLQHGISSDTCTLHLKMKGLYIHSAKSLTRQIHRTCMTLITGVCRTHCQTASITCQCLSAGVRVPDPLGMCALIYICRTVVSILSLAVHVHSAHSGHCRHDILTCLSLAEECISTQAGEACNACGAYALPCCKSRTCHPKSLHAWDTRACSQPIHNKCPSCASAP